MTCSPWSLKMSSSFEVKFMKSQDVQKVFSRKLIYLHKLNLILSVKDSFNTIIFWVVMLNFNQF